MSKDEFRALEPNQVVVIDIREPEELVELPMVPGAKNVPMSTVVAGTGLVDIPKDTRVVAVCASGGRCQALMKELNPQGWDIDYLEGGLIGLNQ